MSDQTRAGTAGEHNAGMKPGSHQNMHTDDSKNAARMKTEQMEWQEKQEEKKEEENFLEKE